MAAHFESGFTVGEWSWHRQEDHKDRYPMSWEEAAEWSGTLWEVKKRKLYATVQLGEETRQLLVHDRVGLFRGGDDQYLGTVSNAYSVYPNEEFWQWWAPYIDDGSVKIECGGSLRDGRVIFALGRINIDAAEVVKGDEVIPFVARWNGHDGMTGKRTIFTNVRVVCENTREMAQWRDGDRSITEVHRGDHDARDKVMHEIMDVSRRRFNLSIERYRQMAKMGFNEAQLKRYVVAVLGKDWVEKDGDKNLTSTAKKILELHEAGRGSDLPGVRGTAWGAFNAVSEFVDHVRGSDACRFVKANLGAGETLKGRAEELAVMVASGKKTLLADVDIPDGM